ncbi:MAG: prepilin-type N-terminal cleavage/methylation domain-containing protein, partial [Clostridia bacterium]|nr:prepilin-type N-terminal cleavage/methylation domain-containing protein [Clostridia bacterium]
MKCQRSNFKHGFTLIEVSIVIAVIAVIISVSIPVFSNIISNARISNDKMTVKNINTVLSVNQHKRSGSASVIEAMHFIVNEGYSASDLEFSDDGCHLVYNSSTAMMVLYDDDFNSILYGDKANSDDLCVIGLKCIESAFSAGITNFCLYSTESTVVIETSYEINIILYTRATILTINAENANICHYGYALETNKIACGSYVQANNDKTVSDNDNTGDEPVTEHTHTDG